MKLKAITPIEHDGKRYDAGKVFEVKDDDQANALIDCGAAEETAGKPETAAEKKAREAADKSAEALINDNA